jgi:hypothetical protein
LRFRSWWVALLVAGGHYRSRQSKRLTGPYPYALIYPQDEHERLLIERLTELGTTVKRETEVLSFEGTDDRVQLKIRKSAGTPRDLRVRLCRAFG